MAASHGWTSVAVPLALSLGAIGDSHQPAGQARTYYIAADEIIWDYAPSGVDEVMGHVIDTTEFNIPNGPAVSARKFRKAVYREYSDSTFKTLKVRPARWDHLGIMGPVLHGEVGDTIRVVFRNNARYAFSIHPHGVFYTKSSEGAPYVDGTAAANRLDDAVPSGGTHTYIWPVPERAGPGPQDPNSIVWPYHSHTHEWRDVNAGLIGAIVIARAGELKADGTPKGIDRELVTLFGVFNESESRYTSDNLKTFTGDTARTAAKGPVTFTANGGVYTINGFAFGNLPLPALTVRRGEHVRWYLIASTNDADFHAAHWHGGTVLIGGQRTDVANLAVPLATATADMVTDVSGVWMLHCHVSGHMKLGMAARFAVVD
jgi:manganese oxidase